MLGSRLAMTTTARIRRLALSNFRSYRSAQIDVAADLVALTGPNGAGKTNLIEAISFLAPGRGLRRATVEEVAFAEGDGSWAVSSEVEGMLGLATLGTGMEPPADSEAAPVRTDELERSNGEVESAAGGRHRPAKSASSMPPTTCASIPGLLTGSSRGVVRPGVQWIAVQSVSGQSRACG